MLVTIIVLTYNSQDTIIETLESIKAQSYTKLEVLLCDDASTDKTIETSIQWLKKNSTDEFRVQILKLSKNSGIVENLNNGIKISKGEWIKVIAGDDILDDKCIQKNLEFIKKNPEAKIVFSQIQPFNDIFKPANFLEIEKSRIKFFEGNGKKQFSKLIKQCFVPAPSAFYEKKIIEKFKYFDKKYPMIEDYPMWLKLTYNNIKLYYFNEITVYYRLHNKSISNTKNIIVNENIFNFRKQIYEDYIKEKVNNPLFHFSEKIDNLRKEDIIKMGNKKKTLKSRVYLVLDPYFYLKLYNKLKEKIRRVS